MPTLALTIASANEGGSASSSSSRSRSSRRPPFAHTPEQMAMIAAGVVALFGSLAWDTPAGPSIVAAATVLFALSLAAGAVWRGRVG